MAQDSSATPNPPNPNDIDSGPSIMPSHPTPPFSQTRGINGHDPPRINNGHNNNNNNADQDSDIEFFKKMRGWLMIVAILAAGSTYQAGLNPPGGFWQDNKDPSHVAGNSVLHDEYFRRYQTFFYCNAISFLSSLVIIILLMNRNFFRDGKKIRVLKITMVLDLFTFMTAYAAGSSRRVTSSIYVILMMGAVFLYVFLMFLMAAPNDLRVFARHMPCARAPMVSNRSANVTPPMGSEDV